MKTTCPGCSKHCSIDHPRCKYGRQFFEKQKQKVCPNCPKKKNAEASAKWESYVQKDGTAWTLLSISRKCKKALRQKTVTEEKLMQNLSSEDREHLVSLLRRLNTGNDC